jgi:hypothetical protein
MQSVCRGFRDTSFGLRLMHKPAYGKMVGRNRGGENLLETSSPILLGFSTFGFFDVLNCEISVTPLNIQRT